MKASCDVFILGAGYTGSLAAAVLARKGYSVALVDRGSHPRFAVGESTTPEQLYLLDWLGRAYGAPELRRLSSYEYIKHHRLPIAVWPKEAFYFLFNPGKFPGAHEFLHQTHPWPAGPTYHTLRADQDHYLYRTALSYGAKGYLDTEVASLDLSGPAVAATLNTPEGPVALDARFIVDASGPGCYLAEKLGLREEKPFGAFRSWSVYSHFTGLKPLEESYGRGWPSLGIPRENTTFHHIDPKGWAWVIPFDNGVTSVGAVLREGDEAAALRDPKTALHAYIADNPAFAAMMEGATPVRPYTATGPLQWRAKKVVGRNWAILPPASGFTDPFFSPGNMVATAGVTRLALGLDAVLKEGRSGEEALSYLETRHQREIPHVARVIHAHFLGFRHPLLFEQAQTLYWLALNLDRAGTGASPDGGPDMAYPQWAAADPGFHATVEEFVRVMEEGGAPEALAPRLEAVLRRGDLYGQLPARTPRLRYTTLAHAGSLGRVRRAARLTGSHRPQQPGPVRALENAGHLLKVLATAPLAPRRPASAGALRMFARHLRIAVFGR